MGKSSFFGDGNIHRESTLVLYSASTRLTDGGRIMVRTAAFVLGSQMTTSDPTMLSSLNKSIQKYNNLMGCQPYAKRRFRQKSERCFCMASGHCDQKGPAHFPRFVYGGSAGFIPRRRATHSTAGAACQGQSRRCAAVLRTLDRLPRLCYLPRRDGGYILQSRPLSLDRERAGG